MGLSDLLDRIKSALGIGGSRGRQQQSNQQPPGEDQQSNQSADQSVGVTVEREPATESEDAVKGTETASSTTETEDEPEPEPEIHDEPDEEPEADEPGEEPEPEEATAEVEPEAAATDTEAAEDGESGLEEPDASVAEEGASETNDSDEAETDESASDEDLGTDEPIDVIKGIGPTYAERLGDADIETVADLATEDADELAEETEISETRLSGWIEKARHR